MILILAAAAALAFGNPTDDASAAGTNTRSGPGQVVLSPFAQTNALGTLQATLDGRERTWYLVRGDHGSGHYSSGVWMEGPEDGLIVSLSGLDSDAPPIHTFEMDVDAGEMSLGEYRGSSFSVTVPMAAEGGPRQFTFPGDDAGASILYTPDAAGIAEGIDMTNLFSLVEGVIEVAVAERTGETVSMRGTFSGTLESIEGGERIEVTLGRFTAESVPSLESIRPGSSPDERQASREETAMLRNPRCAPTLIASLAIVAGCMEADPQPASAPAAAEFSDTAPQSVESQHPLGTPRDDLQRFHGVYGEAGERRNFFVSEASNSEGENPVPPGYLMVGALWGNVQPWHMKSLSDTRFEQAYVGQYQDAPLVVEFHTDDAGDAVALTFSGMFEDRGRLERIGDLEDSEMEPR